MSSTRNSDLCCQNAPRAVDGPAGSPVRALSTTPHRQPRDHIHLPRIRAAGDLQSYSADICRQETIPSLLSISLRRSNSRTVAELTAKRDLTVSHPIGPQRMSSPSRIRLMTSANSGGAECSEAVAAGLSGLSQSIFTDVPSPDSGLRE